MGPLATVCTMYAGLTTLVLMTFKTSVMSQIESLAKDAAKEDEAQAKKEMEAEVEAEVEAEASSCTSIGIVGPAWIAVLQYWRQSPCRR
mmetsp:Transcript_35296/g.94538  ORF Transcript_35296/g.94538 Transcript_35296/m.94538 type:complete len:89 (+) Transcript_35296:199-465(+)